MMFVTIWLTIGLLLIIEGHSSTIETRDGMYRNACAQFPEADQRVIMNVINGVIIFAMLTFLIVYPLVILRMLLERIKNK